MWTSCTSVENCVARKKKYAKTRHPRKLNNEYSGKLPVHPEIKCCFNEYIHNTTQSPSIAIHLKFELSIYPISSGQYCIPYAYALAKKHLIQNGILFLLNFIISCFTAWKLALNTLDRMGFWRIKDHAWLISLTLL